MSWADRILDDGTDRDSWLNARSPVIGASDAAKLARESSIESVLKAKLTQRDWSGNSYTESGHRWEPMMLAWAGIPENKALIHSPDNHGFAATPDGVTADGRVIAECKAKHNKVVTGPALGEWRQVAFQFLAIPEAEICEFIWAEIVNGEMRAVNNGEFQKLTIHRDDPKIIDLTNQLIPLATDLLERLTRALEFEREMSTV